MVLLLHFPGKQGRTWSSDTVPLSSVPAGDMAQHWCTMIHLGSSTEAAAGQVRATEPIAR